MYSGHCGKACSKLSLTFEDIIDNIPRARAVKMTTRRVKNISRKGLKNAPPSEPAEVQRTTEDAEVQQSDISVPMPEPKCSAEASEEFDEIVAGDVKNSPAMAQGSSSVEPLAEELVGAPADVEAVTAPQFGPKRTREAGMSFPKLLYGCVGNAPRREKAPAIAFSHYHLTIV